jgi:hypothetical protein
MRAGVQSATLDKVSHLITHIPINGASCRLLDEGSMTALPLITQRSGKIFFPAKSSYKKVQIHICMLVKRGQNNALPLSSSFKDWVQTFTPACHWEEKDNN